MNLLKLFQPKQESVITETKPLPMFFSEQTTADSSLYEKYQLKPYNPDALYQKKGDYSIYDDMREDDQISTVLALKKLMVVNSDWEIDCEDEDIKEFLESNLKDWMDDSYDKKLYDMLSALDYGISLTEKVFNYRDGKIILEKLKTRPPHTFEIEQDNYGNVTNILQDTATGKLSIDPKKFIHYAYQKEFDNPFGKSELNIGVYRAWWSKNAIIKFWNIYLERFGMPTVVGKLPRSLQSEKENLKKVLRNIQAKTSITIPDEIVLELLESKGKEASQGYESAINHYNMMIARKMLVPDLLGFGGKEISGGSYALGSEHFEIFYSVRDQVQKDLERLTNREIINPLVLWNFGSKYQAKFRFNTTDEKKKKEELKLWLDAVNSGKIPVTDNHINWFLNQVNAPEISEEELKEINEQKEAFKEQLQKGDNNAEEKESPNEKESNGEKSGIPDEEQKGNGKEEKEKIEEDKKPVPVGKKFESVNGQVKTEYYRPLTEYEKRVDFERIDRETQNIENKYTRELADAFKLSINAMVDEIKRKKIIEKKRLDQINGLTFKYKPKIANIIKSMLKESYKFGESSVERPKTFGVIDTDPELTNEDVEIWLKENAFYITGVEEEIVLKKAKGILMDGIRSGASTKEMIKMLDDSLKGYDFPEYDKAGKVINKGDRLDNIVRTNVSKAFNEARSQQYSEMSDFIYAYQFSAILDGRTSAVCRSLDKKIIKPTEKSTYNPPRHYRCRSILLPIFKDIDENPEYSVLPDLEIVDGGFMQEKKKEK